MAYSTKAKKPWVKAPVVRAKRVVRPWSEYQLDIFKDEESGTNNVHVAALAGTGKTATIVESFYHIPTGATTLMCAFNKSIQIELETRAPQGIEVKTIHSIGYAACRKAFPRIGAPDNKKLEGYICADRGNDPETNEVRDNLAKGISLCKSYLAESPEEIDLILDRHDIDTCDDSREKFISSIVKIMAACKRDTARIDFDDMVWLANVYNLPLAKFDRVKIDEAQDLNVAQINLALNSVAPGGRIMSVGDSFQSIYQWRGADSNAIQNIIDRCHSKVFPLSVTYRCAKSIVQLAQTLVPDFQAAPNAEEGSVEYIGENKIENLVKPGDFILSRVNAPLLKWCLILLKVGIPANIQGKDIGASLTYMIKKSSAKDTDSFLSWLSDYETLECDRMIKARRDPSIVQDKAECLRVLCEGTRSLSDILVNIDKLFKDVTDASKVVLSSVHKSKGAERARVFVLGKTFKPSKSQEEANLYYVAITRAKKSLYMVT